MNLKFSEFWMLMFFVSVGCYGGQAYAVHIHYPDIGVGAWLGAIAGLSFAIFFMLPISNETARWKIKMLARKISNFLQKFFLGPAFPWTLMSVMIVSILFSTFYGYFTGKPVRGFVIGYIWGLIIDGILLLIFAGYKSQERRSKILVKGGD